MKGLASGRGNPGSDIDLRVALADDAYGELWETDRTPLLAGLGQYVIVETRFIRAITAEAVTVELAAVKTRELAGRTLYEWELLFSQLPDGQPHFTQLPPEQEGRAWADWDELTEEMVRGYFNIYMTTMVQVPAIFYSGEWHSAIWQLDRMRNELIKLMYRRLDMGYSTRYKHFSDFMPQAWCEQFLETYVQGDPARLQPSALARGYIRLLELWEEHLQVLKEKAGGGL
ncbi:MAG: hypothetical protein R2867_43110 [Caldilineaceae bacterium]